MGDEDKLLDPNVEDQTDGVSDDGQVTDPDQGVSFDDQLTTEDGEGADQKPEEKTEVEKHQERMNFAFQRKQRQLQEQRAANEALQRKLDAANAALGKYQQKTRPVIPPVPDTFDADYDRKMQERDQAILDQKEYDDNVRRQTAAVDQRKKQVVEKRLEDLKTMQNNFVANATKLGMDEKELNGYEAIMAPLVTPANAPIVEYIMQHESGPLLVKYLSTEPLELDDLTRLGPLQAGIQLETKILPKAEKLKPGTTKTPAPIDPLESKGKVKEDNPFIKGASFE